MKPRIVFMGTPEFALPTLEALCENYPVVGVVTQPDRRAGRGRYLTAPPVKELALAEGIPVFQPESLRKMEAVEHIRAWRPEVLVVAAFGQILPTEVLELAPHGVLNIHPSLLPRWRGASPIQAALLAGDAVTGVTVMKLDEGLDTGPILAQREVKIKPQENTGELEARLAQLGSELLIEVLPDYLNGDLAPRPQPEEGVTMSRRLRKQAAAVNWARPADVLSHQVRAFAPDPGAFTFWDGRRLKILKAQPLIGEGALPEGQPGQVFAWQDTPAVITGEGALVLSRLQMAGKRPMSGAAFLRGRKEIIGDILGYQKPGEA
jgi:methionyl-tRNA formyltransferase